MELSAKRGTHVEAEVEIRAAATLEVEGNPTESPHGCEMLDSHRMRGDSGGGCCFSSKGATTLARFPLAAFNKSGGATAQLASQMSDRS